TAAFFALCNYRSIHNIFHVVLLTAFYTIVFIKCSVKLQNIFASCFLMQIINILCNNSLNLTFFLKLCKGYMGFIWFCIKTDKVFLVIVEKNVFIDLKKAVAKYYLWSYPIIANSLKN